MEKIFESILLSYLNLPYIWGGQNFKGVDCSGLAQLALASLGLAPKEDATAQGLYDHFSKNCFVKMYPELGTLLFHGHTVSSITHIRIALNENLCIEAGGGGSHVNTIEDALKINACVRVRPIAQREYDQVAKLTPIYPWL